MPITRSAGNKATSANGIEPVSRAKKNSKPTKREASENEVDSPPKKTGKKVTQTNGKSAPKKKSAKEEVEVVSEEIKKETTSKKKAAKEDSKDETEVGVNEKSKGRKNKKEPAAKKQSKEDKSKDEDEDEAEAEAEVEESNEDGDTDDEAWKSAETIYDFKANDIKGNEVSLDKYKGHVCIIVNVASKCGHTKSNYEQLVEIYDKYSDEKGLKILAFPCNQFGKQEPASNDKICEFVEKKDVKFDMFEKIDVNGKDAHPLWKFLTSKIDGTKGETVEWNFTKFIIDKEGKVVERHATAMKPLQLVENLEKYW